MNVYVIMYIDQTCLKHWQIWDLSVVTSIAKVYEKAKNQRFSESPVATNKS